MILAAALCAEGKAEPPPELRLAWQCNRFRALPLGGGVLEQPAGLLDRMDALLTTWRAWLSWSRRKAGHEGEWAEQHPAEWKIVEHILEMIDGG
jgi:hypothetical protein